MKVLLAGISCVGKTAIGMRLADKLGCPFYDLDQEIEGHFGEPMAKLKARILTPYSFRKECASPVLRALMEGGQDASFVLALCPSGLMDCLYGIIKRTDATVVVLTDTAENILSRITFYDNDSRPISRTLNDEERAYYLKDIRGDISYFKRTFLRADLAVDIAGLGIDDSAAKVERLLRQRQAEADRPRTAGTIISPSSPPASPGGLPHSP
jgi:shikimate kinase